MVRRFVVLKFISHDIVLNGILSGTSFPSSKINSANNSVTFFFVYEALNLAAREILYV